MTEVRDAIREPLGRTGLSRRMRRPRTPRNLSCKPSAASRAEPALRELRHLRCYGRLVLRQKPLKLVQPAGDGHIDSRLSTGQMDDHRGAGRHDSPVAGTSIRHDGELLSVALNIDGDRYLVA